MTLLHQAAQKAATVPLVEQLRSIPADAKLRIDTPNALGCMDTCSIPVGRLCHEAASALQQQPEPAAQKQRWRLDEAASALLHTMTGSEDEEEATPVTLFVGESRDDDGKPVYGLHAYESEYPEEGVVPLVEFAPPALQHQEVPREPTDEAIAAKWNEVCGSKAATSWNDKVRALIQHFAASPSTTRQQTPTHHADCPMAKPGHSERLWNCNCGPLTTRQQEAGGDTRAAFEAWARGYYFDLTRCDPCYVNEPYKHAITDWCWLAWLAAAPSTPEKAGGVSDGVDALGEGQR